MIENQGLTSCYVVGNYCHDVLMDGVVLAESLDGVAIPSTFGSKVGPDFAYSVARSPSAFESSKTTAFHAHFSSGTIGSSNGSNRLESMLDICDTVFVDVQALIRAFDPADGTVSLVHLRDSGFDHLVPRIGYVGVEAARKVVTNLSLLSLSPTNNSKKVAH